MFSCCRMSTTARAAALAVCLAVAPAKTWSYTITFDNLSVGTPVTNQYPGVTFSGRLSGGASAADPVIFDPANGTSSEPRCLSAGDSGEFSDGFLRLQFALDQLAATFVLGVRAGCTASDTVQVRSYSAAGTLIGTANVPVNGTLSERVLVFVRVDPAGSTTFRRVEIEGGLAGGCASRFELIDDVTFVSDITAPVAEITLPAAESCFCYGGSMSGSAYDTDSAFKSWTLQRKAPGASTWTLIRSASTAVTNGELVMAWTPASATQGYYILRLTVENEEGLTSTATTTLWLDRNFDGLDLRAPTAGQVVGGIVCADGTASDHCNGTLSLERRPTGGVSWAPFDTVSPPWVITDLLGSWDTRTGADGSYEIRLNGTDGCGNSVQVQRPVIVDNTAPVGVISSPVACATVQGSVPVYGTVADTYLESWAVQYTGDGGHDWVTIASGIKPVAGGLLGTWDTTALPPCAYSLRLVAVDEAALDCGSGAGNRTEHIVSVNVTSDPLARDRDGDGMPDVWEEANSLNPDDPSDADDDPDVDGQLNLAEYHAGTDPRSSGSLLRMTAIDSVSNETAVAWTTAGSHHYLLQGGASLTSGLASNVSPLISIPPGGASTTEYRHATDAALTSHFYRVRLVH